MQIHTSEAHALIDSGQIKALLERPTEGLQVELKTWLDPRTDEAKAKLIKAIFAIRNRNGGFLVIGYNNSTHLPDPYTFDVAVGDMYHVDAIQGLVSQFASIPFEVSVVFGERDGQTHPVVVIPSGVRIPTVVKRSLGDKGSHKLPKAGDVYFRTLQSNGTASSALLSPADWPDLLEICFENREADIGRFLRRHLSGLDAQAFPDLISFFAKQQVKEGPLATVDHGPPTVSPELERENRARALIERGSERVGLAAKAREVTSDLDRVRGFLTMQVGLSLSPDKPNELPTKEFMNKVDASNPQYTGWPAWLDRRAFHEKKDRAVVLDGAWEALIADLGEGWSRHFEYLRFDPTGSFFLQRVMQDDLSAKVEPGTALDPILMLYRVAEVIAVGLSIGNGLEFAKDSIACFAFRWTGLAGRRLSPWANPARMFFARGGGDSHSDVAQSYVEVPLDTPHSAIAPYVEAAVRPLFVCFDGYSPPPDLVETCVRKLIERNLD